MDGFRGFVKHLGNQKNVKRLLAGSFGVLLLISSLPQKALATAVEYAVMLALIIVVTITAITQQGNGSNVVLRHLQSAVESAQFANGNGDQRMEFTNLSRAIGAAKALMGMTSSCDDCGDARAALQGIIGLAAERRASVFGASAGCNPNGVIDPGEQCDPLANPTGCPITTFPLFCNDLCQCVP